ncbi:MAG: conjugal transfer protein TraF [Pseudomonadota bacterium]
MVNNNRYTLLAAIFLSTITTSTLAAPFNSFDPRSMGMGGVGVAVSNGNTAPLFNPALLATETGEDSVFLTTPAFGGRAYDPDDFVDAVDEFQAADYLDNVDASITAVSSVDPDTDPSTYLNEVSLLSDDIDALNSGLVSISEKMIQGELGGAIIVGLPDEDIGIGFMANSWMAAGGIIHYTDEQILTDLTSDIDTFSQCLSDNLSDPTPCQDLGLTYIDTTATNFGDVTFDVDSDLTSSVEVRGIVVGEVGVSLAHKLSTLGAPVSIGITPKYVKATVFDYEANVDTADEDDFDADDYTEDYADFNLDIGAALEFAPGWRAGLVVKNLIAQEYETMRLNSDTGLKEATGNVVELNPQVRVGVSWQTDMYTLAADLDLMENEPAGLEDPSQYLALGAELNGWDWVQLRLGYRVDLGNSDRSTASIGLGLSPGPLHFDIAFAGNGDEVGAAAQFGIQF